MFNHKQYNVTDWSRPISYHSHNARVSKPYVLDSRDEETERVKQVLAKYNIQLGSLDHLGRNIKFEDIQIGKRRFDHNSPHHTVEWYIHQWKPTNDLPSDHPTGTHKVYDNFEPFLQALDKLVGEKQSRKL